jgi:RNA polymerase-binding transcription factor DksA
MRANPNTRRSNSAFNKTGCLVWYRLHSEREDICEALLKDSFPGSETDTKEQETSKEVAAQNSYCHKTLLQARLRKIDDALDRLMSGSFGNCSKCGRWIEDTRLDLDPAIAFCIECWQPHQSQDSHKRSTGVNGKTTSLQADPTFDSSTNPIERNPSPEGLALDTLSPFDTIRVRTRNSDYRIFLLDPKTGRALVDGGDFFVEPVEALVNGSKLGGFTFRVGWIGIGLRIEFWVNGQVTSTSPVQSFKVEHPISDENVPSLRH